MDIDTKELVAQGYDMNKLSYILEDANHYLSNYTTEEASLVMSWLERAIDECDAYEEPE